MASSLAFATTFAVVLCGCLAAEYGWQPQKELTFSVEGQDVVGLPQLRPQYAGFRYQGELRVQTHSSRVLLLKFFNMSYTKIHEDLEQGWWKGPEAPVKNKTKQLPTPTSTVVVKMTRSMSPELIMQSGLDEWQVNFIKGIVSHLLVYLNDNSPSGHYFNKLTNTQARDVYSIFEESVSGRCEVMYEISRLPSQLEPQNQHLCDSQNQLWEITKTRNFSNCQVLSEDHGRLPNSDCLPGGSNCGRFWTRASLTQMIGCGEMNNLLLLSSVSSSVNNAQLHLKNSSQAVLNSNLNITLKSVSDLKSKFNTPSDKQTMKTLLYSYSATPKEFSSHKCQDTTSKTEDEDDSHEHIDTSMQINPTKEDDKKYSGSREPTENKLRTRRDIKYNKYNRYRANSNELDSDENSDEQQSSKQNSKHYKNDRSASKKNGGKRWFSNKDKTSNDDRFISEEKNDQSRNSYRPDKNDRSEESNDQFSDESNNEHSEEMDLEELWKISGKDTKDAPAHQPFNMFALAHRTSQDLSCLKSKLQQIIGDITSDLKEINSLPEKSTMDKLSTAVDVCRSLPYDQLSAISEEVFEMHNGASNAMKSDERKVFRDIITMCGSHPAFRIIKGWVERQQIEGEEAAHVIASLPNQIFSPNKYLIQDFFDMVQQIAEKEDEQLTITALLSFSNLVRSACVNQASRQHKFSSIVKPICDEGYVSRYVDWLSHKLSSDAPLRRAYIEALGNVGSHHTIEILKSIAVNPTYSTYQRTSAVFAMRYQALKKHPEMAPLLMSLYHNYSMPVSARIASAALLVYTEPSLAVWQRLAISTWYEPSSAVSQFVSSSLRNIARSKDSLYGEMTKAAALVQPLARPSKISTNRPFNMMSSWLSSDLEKLVFEQLSWMQFSDFSNIYYRHSSRYSGFSRTNLEASLSGSNPDDLWSTLQELISTTTDVRNNEPRNQGASYTIADIENTLNLEPRRMPSLQAELHLKVNNMMERMILINRETIQSMAKGGRKLISEVLREGKSLSYQKIDMDGFHISTTTEMGFPVKFSVRTPWIVRAKTEMNATMKGLSVEAALLYSAEMQSSVSVMSPWDNVAHMAGAYATNFVQLPPVRLMASIDSANDSITITTNYIEQHRLLYFNMQPFTSQRKIKVNQPALLSPDTIAVKLGESVQMPISYGMRGVLNTVYSSERPEHFNAWDFFKQARGLMGFPMIFKNMEPRTFETVMNPLHPVTMNFSMSMATKSMGVLDYSSLKDSFVSKILYSLDKITSLGQSHIMSAFRFFGGLFGGKDESATTENPSNDNSEETCEECKKNKQGESHEDGKDSSKPSRNDNDLKDQVSNIHGQGIPAAQVYTTTYESAVGGFNASDVNPFSNSAQESRVSYLLAQVLSKINSGSAVVYLFEMQSSAPEKPTHFSALATYATTYSGRVNRFGLFMKKDQNQVKMTAVHEDPADITSDLKRRVTEDLQHNLYLDLVHSTNEQDMKVFMKAQLGVSRSELIALRNSPLLRECSQAEAAISFKCQQLREQTQQISFGNMTAYYSNDAKHLEKMVVKYINAAKVMIPGTQEKSGEGYNTVTMLFDVDQKTRSVDSFITTPDTSVKIHRLPLSKLPMSTLAEWATQPDAVSDYCGVSPKQFRTFDGAESSYDMKDGWHLVLHDRTRKYGISVIAQSSNNNSMKIEVNKDDQLVMRVEEGPKVYVNNKLQLLDKDHSVMVVNDRDGRMVMHTTYTPDSSVRIQMPDQQLNLRYSTSSLLVRAGPALHGRLCGICGSYSNTGAESLLMAHGHSAKSAAEYAASFRLGGSSSSQSGGKN